MFVKSTAPIIILLAIASALCSSSSDSSFNEYKQCQPTTSGSFIQSNEPSNNNSQTSLNKQPAIKHMVPTRKTLSLTEVNSRKHSPNSCLNSIEATKSLQELQAVSSGFPDEPSLIRKKAKSQSLSSVEIEDAQPFQEAELRLQTDSSINKLHGRHLIEFHSMLGHYEAMRHKKARTRKISLFILAIVLVLAFIFFVVYVVGPLAIKFEHNK